MYSCPECQRSFTVAGFCPYDGKQLVLDTEPDADDPHKVRAISAHEAQSEVVESMRKRVSELDRWVGETLEGRYHVERKIGEGGMGVVFAVKHAVIERPLAIKILKRKAMRDPSTVQRFIQEARAASRIGHPNIVDVTDFGKTPDGMTYSVMEYIEGPTLSKTIKDNAPLPVERVVRIASQIARALAAAHAKGIVHRDLKPENVFLVEREGRPDFVKIVDFGIAKVQPVEGRPETAGPRLTRAGAVFGTPEYMAPEQAAGRGDTDHRVDVYALGTILYEMLVGKVPHKGDSLVRTIAMQMLDPITPPSKLATVPPALEAITMKALAKKREDRYQSMTELLAELEKLPDEKAVDAVAQRRRAKPTTRPLHEPEFAAPGTPISAGSVSFSHVYDAQEPPQESRRWPFVVAALVMLVLGAGVAVLVIGRMQRGPAPLNRDAAVISSVPDAAAPTVDAAVIVEVPVDAGPTRPVVAKVPGDAGVARPERRTVTIEVMTRPGDAQVFIDRHFRGPSGVRIAEPYGTKRKIECKTERMKGSVEVVFDGSRSAVMCTATRDRFCVPGLKNPYDDCEEDPNQQP